MLSENIILQSAGSLSVAILALLMLILQTIFFFRKPQFTWYAWSAAISFSALLYSVGIFLEYNTPEGPLNRFSGLLEYTAIICLIHCLYGFTFSYLGIESKRYHPVAGVCHGLILILLWFTNYIVAESFTTRNFIGLESPYIEPALGPLGPVFVLYAAIAGVNAMIVWIKHKGTDPKHRIAYLAGIGFWILLGIHDALASLGVPTFQYVMEYGFLGFSMVVLWVVFNSYLEITAEEKYRVITEFANDCIVVIQDEKMVFENPACCDLIGRPLTDSEPRDFLDIMASEDRKTVFEHFNTLLEGGHVPNPHAVRIRRTDGERRFVEIASSVIRYRNRPAVLAVMRDMTERKQAEDALRESEEKYRSMMESMNDPAYICSPDYHVEYMNSAMVKRTGRDAVGEPCYKVINKLDDKCPWCVHDKVQQGENCMTEGVSPKDNHTYSVSHSPIHHVDGSISKLAIYRDVTEVKNLEAQLQQAKKMETIGTLAGGVAHDLNNILSGIISYPEMILMDLPENSPLRKPILTIKSSGEKAAAVVQDLLTLARRGVTITKIVNLNSIISEQLKSPEYEKLKSFHPDVNIKTNLEKNLLNINGSTAHLSKTVFNLISNAAEAMPDGGKVLVSTENQYIDRPIRGGYDQVDEGDYVTVTVSDTGIGISEEDMERIFEPFYTKKVMGRSGSGLGMSVVWGTVKDHNGYIDIESTKGKGTTFTLYFPITRQELAIDKSPILIEDYMGKGESILIVDDVEEQREIASGMLKKLGYSVTSVSSGEEAIEYMKDNSVDLLVLDMIMDPGIDGLETYKRILKLHPKQKAIIASGFSETDRVKEAKKLGAGAYVKKPYVLEKIGVVIKEELEK